MTLLNAFSPKLSPACVVAVLKNRVAYKKESKKMV